MTGHISSAIKREARRLGFDAAGIAQAEEMTEESSRLRAWLARGYHAGMDWMERSPERRTDPTRVLEGARSIVSVALNYYTPSVHSPEPGSPKISRYAWGEDYHQVLEGRLRQLEEFMKSLEPGVKTRGYVDTGPVMDKAWAARAGIGWVGKHTNVITRSHGTWVFLGTIITSLECAPDEPATDMCGTCTACLDACPTGAFPQPYVLDAGKCISYLTIEHRGEVDAELTRRYDGWIFGCDICQDVCPWNRFQKPTGEEAFEPRPGMVEPDVEALSGIAPEEFSRRFNGSPIKRAKAEGMTRNVRYVSESSGT